jgi:hypothetical protein
MGNFIEDFLHNVFGGGQAKPSNNKPSPAPANPRQQWNPTPVAAPLPDVKSLTLYGGNNQLPAPKQDKPRDFWQGVGDYFGNLQKQSDERKKQDFENQQRARSIGMTGYTDEGLRALGFSDPQSQVSQAARTPREKYADSLNGPVTPVGTRELSMDEWNSLTRDQQQAVVANAALYNATQADKALHQKTADQKDDASYLDSIDAIFGKEGGSDVYAPNTVKVLGELGYKNDKSDLDLFLNGSAASTLDQIKSTDQGARTDLLHGLATAPQAFGDKNQTYQAALEKGASILDALKSTGTFSPEVSRFGGVPLNAAQRIPEDKRAALSDMLVGMADQGVWNTITTDPEKNAQFTQALQSATSGLPESDVADFFKEQYGNLSGDNLMPFEQFSKYWLKG